MNVIISIVNICIRAAAACMGSYSNSFSLPKKEIIWSWLAFKNFKLPEWPVILNPAGVGAAVLR